MRRLHVFGDSYSVPDFCVKPKQSWWGLISDDIGVDETVNWSWRGTNIDNIAHTMLSYQKDIYQNDYVVVGIPPLSRVTVYEPDVADHLPMKPTCITYNKNLQEMQVELIRSHSGLYDRSVADMGKKFVNGWNSGYAEACALRTIALLLKYFENTTAGILFFNMSSAFQPKTTWSPLEQIQKLISDDSRVELYNTYQTVNQGKNTPVDFKEWGWAGHHDHNGNLEFYTAVVHPMLRKHKWL